MPWIMRFIKSKSFYVNLVSPSAQYFFHEVYIRMIRAMQLVLVECSSYRFSTIVENPRVE